jgi:hypothetical protein
MDQETLHRQLVIIMNDLACSNFLNKCQSQARCFKQISMLSQLCFKNQIQRTAIICRFVLHLLRTYCYKHLNTLYSEIVRVIVTVH